MKKSHRIGTIIEILSHSPNKVFSLNDFCTMFNAAKSSISEDLTAAREITKNTGFGYIETIPGAQGGVRYIPSISDEKTQQYLEGICAKLREQSRVLGGGFLYTSDIMFDPVIIQQMAAIFARKFRESGAEYVATIETKGIPLAMKTAELLNIPCIVVRRESKVSEGATMSINYLSGSADRLQKMSVSKRAAQTGKKALIIDDFMRGGGSIKGITEILGEFDTEIVGIGVAIVSKSPEKKKIRDFTPLICMGNLDEENKKVDVAPNSQIFS